MKSHFTIFTLIAVAILLAIYLLTHKKLTPINESSPKLAIATNVASSINQPPPNVTTNHNNLPEPSRSVSSAGASAREPAMQDPYSEYKLPISFYGKIVDDQGQPVADASVAFSWTDLSQEGTSQQNAVSDTSGNFSLVGKTGKSLTVEVSKQGYQTYYSSNRFSFEYSSLANADVYYNSDPNNPVIFTMRRNRDAELLLEYKEKRAEIKQGENKEFVIAPNDTILLFERFTNGPGRWDWVAQVSVPNGGLQLTTEEFPYEAPTDGYADFLVISNGTPKPPNWFSDNGAMLYFKTAQGYGRVMVRYISAMNRMFVTSWFNPNVNSHNLEVDPSKVQIINP